MSISKIIRSSACFALLLLAGISVPAHAQATVAGAQRFILEAVVPGKVTARQLRMVWQFLREGQVYDPAATVTVGDVAKVKPRPITPAQEQAIRRIAAQFQALDLYDTPDVKVQPPAIKPGDLLVQFAGPDYSKGVVTAVCTYDPNTTEGQVVAYGGDSKQISKDDHFNISPDPQDAAIRLVRPLMIWLRPRNAAIKLDGPSDTQDNPQNDLNTQAEQVVNAFYNNLSHRNALANLPLFLRPDTTIIGIPGGEGENKIWQKRADAWLYEYQRDFDNLGRDSPHTIDTLQVYSDSVVAVACVTMHTPSIHAYVIFVFTFEGGTPKIISFTFETRA